MNPSMNKQTDLQNTEPVHALSLLDSFDKAVEQVLGQEDLEVHNLEELMSSEPELYYEPDSETTVPADAPYYPVIVDAPVTTVHHIEETPAPVVQAPQGYPLMAQTLQINEPEELPKPKRALSAYNLYFQTERKKILDSLPEDKTTTTTKKGRKGKKSKIGFTDMARQVAKRWKTISAEEKMEFEYRAAMDSERYEKEMKEWKQAQEARQAQTSPLNETHVVSMGSMSSFNGIPIQQQHFNAQWGNHNVNMNEQHYHPMNAGNNMFLQGMNNETWQP